MQHSKDILIRNIQKILDFYRMTPSGLSKAIQEQIETDIEFPDEGGLRKRMNKNTAFKLEEIDLIADFYHIPVAALFLPGFDPAGMAEYARLKTIKDLLGENTAVDSRPGEISPSTWSKMTAQEREEYLETKRTNEIVSDYMAFLEAGYSPDLFLAE